MIHDAQASLLRSNRQLLSRGWSLAPVVRDAQQRQQTVTGLSILCCCSSMSCSVFLCDGHRSPFLIVRFSADMTELQLLAIVDILRHNSCQLQLETANSTTEVVAQGRTVAGWAVLTIKRCKLPCFGNVCQNDTLPKIMLQATVDGRGRLRKIMEGQHQGMDRPIIVVAVAHRRRQMSKDDHHSRGVCQSKPTTPGHHGNLISNHVCRRDAMTVFAQLLVDKTVC